MNRHYRSLQEATQFELKSKKDIMCITSFMDTFKIAETSVDLPNKVETDDLRLLRMTIAKFSGDVLKWETFYESFTTAIHQPNINNVHKFNYLVGYLEGQAKRTVEGFKITNEITRKHWIYCANALGIHKLSLQLNERTFEDQICEIG